MKTLAGESWKSCGYCPCGNAARREPMSKYPSTLPYIASALAAAFAIGCSSAPEDGRPATRAPKPGATNTATNAGSGGSSDAFGNSPTVMGGAGSAAPSTPMMMMPAQTTCAEGDANTSPVTPTVWLVLDGSGSMKEDFGGQSRWDALRAALMDPGGVVDTLQHSVRFGMVLYSGNDNDMVAAGGECFQLVTVQPALDNYSMLSAQYPAMELGGWTPTDRALDNVVSTLPVTNSQVVLDAKPDPIYVILATDGAPNDQCSGDGGNRTRGGGSSQFDPVTAQRVLDVVGKGVQMGMQMFVISLAGGDQQLAMHLEQVADLGGTGQPPFTPSNKDDLVSTLQQIIGNATCQVRLSGSVIAGKECSGEVSLNGNALACNQPDGWKLADASTVQLTGAACDTFLQTQSLVHAAFPCDAFSPD
jgi:hypothetical protein